MEKKVVGVFTNEAQAQEIVKTMRDMGYEKEISIIAKGRERENNALTMGDRDNTDYTNYPILEDRDGHGENLHGLGVGYGDGYYFDMEGSKRNVETKRKMGDQEKAKNFKTEEESWPLYPEESNVTTGTLAGGALGGLTGLALSLGVLAIPGIGPIIAAGPIAAVLSSAVVGGVTGGLIDWGIPQAQSADYEKRIKGGQVLVAVECNEQAVEPISRSLKQAGAIDIKVY